MNKIFVRGFYLSLIINLIIFFTTFAQNKMSPQMQLALAIDSSLYHRSPDVFQQNWDYEVFSIKVFKPFKLSPEEILYLSQDLKNNLKIGEVMLETMGDTGSYEFVKILEKSHRKKSLLFRSVDQSGWLNYHEIFLNKVEESYKIEDIYTYDAAMWLSSSISSIFMEEGGFPVKNPALSKYMALGDSVFYLNRVGQFEKALEVYNKLPKLYQEKEEFLISAVVAASFESQELQSKYIQKYVSLYPSQTGLSLILIDIFTTEGEYNKAIEQVEYLSKMIGGDTYLNYKKACLLYKNGNIKKAKKLCLKLKKRKSHLGEVYLLLLDCYYKEKKYNLFLNELIEMAKLVKKKPSDIFSNEDYPDFFSSKKWVDYQLDN